LIQETACGVNIPPENPELLAEAILRLRCQQDLLTDMGQNGRRHLELKFSRVRCVDMYENMLTTLVQE
jgi:hypothetical protein